MTEVRGGVAQWLGPEDRHWEEGIVPPGWWGDLYTNAGRQLGMDHTTVRFRLRLCSSFPSASPRGYSAHVHPCVWLSFRREGFHSEVSYILATSKTSQEDGLFLRFEKC